MVRAPQVHDDLPHIEHPKSSIMTGTDADGNNPTPREVNAKNANADLGADNSTGKDEYDRALVLRRLLDDMAKSEDGASDAKTLCEWIRPLVKEGIAEDINMKDGDGQTLLHVAARQGLATAAKSLIDTGANVDTQDDEGSTPLIEACWWDNMALVEILLNKGADVKIFDNDGWSSLFLAARHGNNKEKTALHCAVWQNNLQMVKFLLEHGADINAQDPDGQQTLHLASLQGNEAILRFLLDDDNCSHLDTGDDDGMTPLHLASCPHQVDYTDSLPDSDSACQVDEEMNNAESDPVSKAGQYNKVVHHLLARKADTTLLTKDGKTAVELAFDHQHHKRGEAVLKVFSENYGGTRETLMWAAGKTERHAIAMSLVKRQLNESGNPLVKSSEDDMDGR
ncbi:Death-associated protein kinase 1 [Colletotrichum viniferum]|nr:Death-associated protein kinase 1 [Colletotrichum viniferum]